MMIAAMKLAKQGARRRGLTLIFTSGEETGCTGAIHLVAHGQDIMGTASAMIVGEPTENQFSTAHKGALYMRAKNQRRHGSFSTPRTGR